MGHSSDAGIDPVSARDLVAEVEGHLRALLRDVLCGYLEADLKSVADDILIETHGEPLGEIEARDMREEPEPEPEELRARAPRGARSPTLLSRGGADRRRSSRSSRDD